MLEIQHITKSFTRRTVLNNISFCANKGEVFGLLGPNGAGKTTLIRIINRILEPDRGIIKFNGELLSEGQLARIGYLPEERGLYRSMTVEAHALLLCQLRGLSLKNAQNHLNHWLEKFEILDWKKKRIEELSKGMAQKIQFICAVIHNPDLLILDEPLSGFDPINTALILSELKTFKNEGKTIILSTHNMQSVEDVCDRIALLNESKIILEGKVSDLQQERKKGDYGIRFRGSMIAFVNALWTGFELVEKETIADDRFMARVKMRDDNHFEDLLKALIGQVQIEAAWEILPSMQDIFIDLVNKEKEATHA